MSSGARLGRAFFARDALTVAPELLGCVLRVGPVVGSITEVEAYRRDDPASHSFRGPTPRNTSMFSAPGTLYVYISYGIHFCANVVTGDPADGQAVLLRAVEISGGHDIVAARRMQRPQRDWTNGPGKLCQAYGIDLSFDGIDLVSDERMGIEAGTPVSDPDVTTRIGITVGVEQPWRWVVARRPPAGRGRNARQVSSASASSNRAGGTSPSDAPSAGRRAT